MRIKLTQTLERCININIKGGDGHENCGHLTHRREWKLNYPPVSSGALDIPDVSAKENIASNEEVVSRWRDFVTSLWRFNKWTIEKRLGSVKDVTTFSQNIVARIRPVVFRPE